VDLTFRLAFAALVLGGATIAICGGGATRRQVFRTVAHGLACLVGAVGYFGLMVGQRTNEVLGFELATRSIDWILVIPLLVLSLAVTAAPLGKSIVPMTATAMFLGAVSALASAIADQTVGASVWVWFAVWLVALGLVFGVLWQPMADSAASGHPLRNETYRRHAAVLTVLLALFPIAFLFGPDMLYAYGRNTTDAIIAFLDVVLMAGYGLLVVFEDEKLVEIERAAEAVGPERAAAIDSPDAPAILGVGVERGAISGGRFLEPGDLRAGAGARLGRLQLRTDAARAASGPVARRIADAARDPLGFGPKLTPREPPAVVRRRRRRKNGGPFPFAAFAGRESGPAALVALTLFVIANARRDRR
jgi:hypothetical protein